MILNKSSDLIFTKEPRKLFRRFRKEAAEIRSIKLEWNKKMAKLELEGHEKKEIMNNKVEGKKLEDLEFLKKQAAS